MTFSHVKLGVDHWSLTSMQVAFAHISLYSCCILENNAHITKRIGFLFIYYRTCLQLQYIVKTLFIFSHSHWARSRTTNMVILRTPPMHSWSTASTQIHHGASAIFSPLSLLISKFLSSTVKENVVTPKAYTNTGGTYKLHSERTETIPLGNWTYCC